MTPHQPILEQESLRATQMLKGKIISAVYRHGENEVLIQFTDGTRFFIDKNQSGLELSITAAEPEI